MSATLTAYESRIRNPGIRNRMEIGHFRRLERELALEWNGTRKAERECVDSVWINNNFSMTRNQFFYSFSLL